MIESWYIGAGRTFDAELVEFLRKTEPIKVVDKNEFVMLFTTVIQQYKIHKNARLNIIMDINCSTCIRQMISLMRQIGRCVGLRVILLSNFETWIGKSSSTIIVNATDEFFHRVPISCSYGDYCLENALENATSTCGALLCIVGSGLFYGADGIDLKDVLLNIWNNSEACDVKEKKLLCLADMAVPFVSIQGFVEMIAGLLKADENELPTFVPAIDCPIIEHSNVLTLHEIMTRFSVLLNGPSESPYFAKSESSESESPVWRSHLPFGKSTIAGNILSNTDQVWTEFLKCNYLQPLAILIAGPPQTGKSDLATALAQRLQVELINLESAVKFLFHYKTTNISQDVEKRALLASVTSAQEELRAAMEAKASEGKKPAKGAAPAEDTGVDEAMLTTSFCKTLSVELLRKCVSAQAQLQSSSQRRGFVLDMWDGKTVTGIESLAATLNSIHPLESNEYTAKIIEVVVELHCPSVLPVERLIASQGAQAKSKEAQAAVKTLEGQLSTYRAELVSVSNSETISFGSNEMAEHMLTGSQGVLDIAESGCIEVVRIDCAGGNAETLAQTASTAIIRTKGGRIGWLPETSVTSPAPDVALDKGGEILAEVQSPPESLLMSADKALSAGVGSEGSVPMAVPVQDHIKQLDKRNMSTLASRAQKLQDFLTASVLPQLSEGMVKIMRDQPEDPIMFLAQHLHSHSAQTNQQAEERARQRYEELLHQGCAQ